MHKGTRKGNKINSLSRLAPLCACFSFRAAPLRLPESPHPSHRLRQVGVSGNLGSHCSGNVLQSLHTTRTSCSKEGRIMASEFGKGGLSRLRGYSPAAGAVSAVAGGGLRITSGRTAGRHGEEHATSAVFPPLHSLRPSKIGAASAVAVGGGIAAMTKSTATWPLTLAASIGVALPGATIVEHIPRSTTPVRAPISRRRRHRRGRVSMGQGRHRRHHYRDTKHRCHLHLDRAPDLDPLNAIID